jgi:hypothetical protein
VGAVGVGAEVDAGVTGTTMGVTNGGFGCVDFGSACSGCPIYGPVLPGWTILVCRIVCVCSVGCKVKRTF